MHDAREQNTSKACARNSVVLGVRDIFGVAFTVRLL